jgi:glucose/arabinose dehydrogenase
MLNRQLCRKTAVSNLLGLVPAVLLLGTLMSCGGGSNTSGGGTQPPPTTGSVKIALAQIAAGFINPLGIEQSDDNTGRFFVVEQAGKIRILQNGSIIATPFLDITSKVTSGGETGLLGLAFHPGYATNRHFYLNYTRTSAGQLQTVIAEYATSTSDPNLADPNSERILLIQNQPFDNHNGGQLVFGPDAFLYIGLGDGGSGGDPLGNGQNKNVLLGKVLRIDVDHTSTGKQYAIPADNPFATSGGAPEVFAYGFRNPWRFSFDLPSNRFFVADVGQDAFEEVDIVTKAANYGWNVMEGTHCFNPSTGCSTTGLTPPIIDYPHSDGIAVIGGFVYRGTAIANLPGAYVFGDFGSGRIWMLQENPANTWTRTELLNTGKAISSFGRDKSGELYVLDYSAGVVFQVKPGS